ncbi:17466_t:CDS:2, partial [Funneliformis geosporum]
FLAKLKTLTLYPPALISEEKKSNFLKEENRKLIKNCFGKPLARCLQESANFKQKKLKIGLITGKISPSQKTEFISAFQKGEIKILLCNIQSAGMGLNLSQADIAIFADRSYSPADNEQAEARFLPTQDSENPKSRLIIDLICKGTIDEKISNLLKRKKDITKIITTNLEYLL